ncbi:MAG: hypothetical protein NUV77_24200 [Thermoguttaceae bacterium]|jgi:hypothetical protein|nr:hypothetical protein [Thermoguttaceae bacterium]
MWLAKALVVWLATSAAVFVGAWLGSRFLPPARGAPEDGALVRFDGRHYREIVSTGYSYDASQRSTVAYFPAYPTAAWVLQRATRLEVDMALLVTSNAFLAGATVGLASYARSRIATGDGQEPEGRAVVGDRDFREATVTWTLLAFGLWPMGFFFRTAHSESTFLFFAILSLYGIRRNWPRVLVALLAGVTTATRPVGIALCLPFMAWLWQSEKRWCDRLAALAVFGTLACWGLAAYMAFQQIAFGDALAFAKTQTHWTRLPPAFLAQKTLSLLSWEPLWATYDPGNPAFYWKDTEPPWPILNCRFLNPVYFGLAIGLVGLGAWRGWLDRYETLLSAGLLIIPYVTKGYDNAMLSHGRFAAVVFPAYLVAGQLLQRLPRALAWTLLGTSGFFLAAYAALFAAGYPFF